MARGRGELTPNEIRIRKEISNKLNDLLILNNKKQIDIHNSTGIPKSTLTGYFKGTSIPNSGNIQKLANFFGVKKSEIDPRYSSKIPYTGKNVNSSIETIYKKLEPPRKEKVYSYAAEQLQEQETVNNKVVPLVGKSAANPAVLEYGDTDIEQQSFAHVPDNADCAIYIQGDSMEPLIKNGSIVFYKKQCDVENGEIAIVEIDGDGVTCKKLIKDYENELIILRSINKKYDDRVLKDEEIKIIGKVVI